MSFYGLYKLLCAGYFSRFFYLSLPFLRIEINNIKEDYLRIFLESIDNVHGLHTLDIRVVLDVKSDPLKWFL